MLPIELKYIKVVWKDPETFIKVECSRDSLEIEGINEEWKVETTTYPGLHLCIGICIKEHKIKHIPYFKLANGQKEALMQIKVPGANDVWWIEKGRWNEEHKTYFSKLYNTTGRAELIIQNQKLILENNTLNFSIDELEYYLADFKNNLWILISDDNSTAKAKITKEIPSCFNDEGLSLFRNFIQSVRKIIDKPGIILSETQGKLPLRAVKPMPRTFREYVTQPNTKLLTSRTHIESYDTAENRFIHYCVNRMLYILKKLANVANSQKNSYERKIAQEKVRLDTLNKADTKIVDSKVYDNEIATLELGLKEMQRKLSEIDLSSNDLHDLPKPYIKKGEITCRVKLGKPYAKLNAVFFLNEINTGDYKKLRNSYNVSYAILKFPSSYSLQEIQCDLKQYELKIHGHYISSVQPTKKGKNYFELRFRKVYSVEVISSLELDRLRIERTILEQRDWIAPLTRDEREDRKVENDVATRNIALCENLQKIISEFSSRVPLLYSRLIKIASFFKEHKVKTRSDCPNTMTFIQNPSYASAKKYYNKIKELNGLDESILNSLEVIDEIGLVNIPTLYEKWCLLKIIEVLKFYGFSFENDWQATLIDAVLHHKNNTEIKFRSREHYQKIILTYQNVLCSGKIPDFVIDLISKDKKDCNISKRLILDAKFKGEMSENDLDQLIDELYFHKDYSENAANQVFIIHPSPDIIKNTTSPLNWGTHCDYGQSHKRGHQKGGIFISPSFKATHSIDNLKRLIGMFLQENSRIDKAENPNRCIWNNMICISCGNSDSKTLKVNYKPTGKGNDGWSIACTDCGLLTVKTICYECRHTIFKNGSKWTYHRTRAEQTSNVVCPKCEALLTPTDNKT